MDKWFKDILPDKDPYHNRGRDQMRKKRGPEFECLWATCLERIQRRAARYVTNRYHNTSYVSDMLDQFEWPSLESCRTNSRLTMMYKMTKNLANFATSDKLIPLQRPSRNCNTLAFSIPLCKISIRKESFYPKTTKDWNALKDASVGAPSLEAFKACLCQ
jgi:hypothetical protein